MTASTRSIKTAAATAVLSCMFAVAPNALAQAHVQQSADYVVRSSTVRAANLPDTMRERYGIGTDANTAVLNITVQQQVDGALRNVPAHLEVKVRNLYGVYTSVDMREVVANGFVSYMGTYPFLPREVLDFQIAAYPRGTEQTIHLEFRDRLGRH